ncbi:ribosome maturation factor RimM [Candidatus Purcelliella pentastirinorum]|uniref:Ribosome maturation factor RimM n=1 Tax=Candidatus Purcelliella pentastirinorum TaxID=472834 RepID=A0AAX3N7V7_9ENTR|nr:ribosome maturation factor RimM [Candidatus Purcelliella pentastirinorum]WDI78647.1 ribosome maturation factor RimM [Candidatus Purcelliella pentastirinorum]WDR80325.1 ribosome maturation factor RimM [Candidatus Purcelliella pentastirinorum]
MNKKIKENEIIIGKIGKTLGIKGWLKINSFFKIKENIFDFKTWKIKKNNYKSIIKIENWKKHYKKIIIKIKNINNINEAKILTNCDISVHEKQIFKKNYFLINKIKNYEVIDAKKKYIGKIIKLITIKKNTILVIQKHKKTKKKLIPFINNKIIKKINHKKKQIKIDWNK